VTAKQRFFRIGVLAAIWIGCKHTNGHLHVWACDDRERCYWVSVVDRLGEDRHHGLIVFAGGNRITITWRDASPEYDAYGRPTGNQIHVSPCEGDAGWLLRKPHLVCWADDSHGRQWILDYEDSSGILIGEPDN
jgi:hypothetical protein